jgi:nuclease-like protein
LTLRRSDRKFSLKGDRTQPDTGVMGRIVSPPPNELHLLPTPLNSGEQKVLDALVLHLGNDWSIFVQPKLHTKEPDFVVAHPVYGVTIIEVKAWMPDNYRTDSGRLQVRDGRGWQPCDQQPRRQCARYRKELAERFFLDPGAPKVAFSLVRGVVVLPFHRTNGRGGARELIDGIQPTDEHDVCPFSSHRKHWSTSTGPYAPPARVWRATPERVDAIRSHP